MRNVLLAGGIEKAMSEMLTQKQNDAPAIEFRNVSLTFDEGKVLDCVSFVLHKGEMFFLTGESGSGKSVLLKLAMGLIRPGEGEIFIEGREIETLDESELLAIRGGSMGIVFQEDSLFTGLKVFDNVAFRLEEHDWDEDETEKAVREILAFVGLSDVEDQYPEELSGGMKHRLGIARAIVGFPRIMLFDEPTLELDPVTAEQILNLVLRARDQMGMSSIYVTKKLHEIEYLSSYCAMRNQRGETDYVQGNPMTKVLVLKDGKIVFEGSYKEFSSSSKPEILTMTQALNGTVLSDYYVANPWNKRRRPHERIL